MHLKKVYLQNKMGYKTLLIFVLIIVIICGIFALIKFNTKHRYYIKPAATRLYLNNQGNGTNMVLGGFSSPNHLYGMNMVPYNGPL